ncbi:hypothetical protein OG21DRAFT_1501150 [Imleria badia]|nr:hypothetical protein OG21DRAFT_1501150 [Imleria badia]
MSSATIGPSLFPHQLRPLPPFNGQTSPNSVETKPNKSSFRLNQSWDVHVGKQYDLVVTTRDGLWRYRLGDVVFIVGFDAEMGAPITGAQLLEAIQAPNADPQEDSDALWVQEFTTVIDDREVPPTVGF